ncbi:hypothetical protein I6N95_15040 [Vagococcus sp. BWB3-3]|uniref:Uncharacterized protein n=1 Tax=Vagococcus allomyrinae TaxID=2794353 RepID=A0A940P653_9ENTE|nr:hypothetical protein [Vagococcus allomyrinae]MBP1042334.1 hypothetical protein [Vagococcus allomyrinae]
MELTNRKEPQMKGSLRKNQLIPIEEYDQLKQLVVELPWVWQRYQRELPDGWFVFKYQSRLRLIIGDEEEERLFSQASRVRLLKRMRVPKRVYQELKELAAICLELQDVLDHPPYGSLQEPALTSEGSQEGSHP